VVKALDRAIAEERIAQTFESQAETTARLVRIVEQLLSFTLLLIALHK